MPVTRQHLVEALERVAAGDSAAFKMLYDATSMKLYGIVVRILGRRDLADEILQEVYVRVWQNAGDYNAASGSPITWMATIARNRALDEATRKTMRSLEDFPEVLEVPSGDSPEADLERSQELRRLQGCLDKLEQENRELVLRVYYFGMTREEIAHHMGRPVSTVKTRLRRSLAQLKDCLSK